MSSAADSSDWWFGRKKHEVKPGDGRPLKLFRMWQGLGRSLFYAPLETQEGEPHLYAVDVNFFDWEDRADLYLNGVHHAESKLPAAFPVVGGHIEVASTLYGLKRMHYVDGSGQARVLKPDPVSAEGMRAKLAARAPLVSKLIGLLAAIILLTLLPVSLLQLAEMASQIEWVQQNVGSFTSPLQIPEWASTPIFILTLLAVTERTLTLRNHWLIDMETGWFE